MEISELAETKSVFRRYEELRAENPDLRSDPYKLYRWGSRPGIGRRAVKSDPLDGAKSFWDLKSFVREEEERQKRSSEFDSKNFPKGIDPENVISKTDEYCVYKVTGGGMMDGERVCLALANGAKYFIETRSTMGIFIVTQDEWGKEYMPERMFRNIPGLAETLAPLFAEPDYGGSYHMALNFAHTLKYAGKPSMLEEGIIAKAFEDKYREELEIIERIQAEERENPKPHRGAYHARDKASQFFNLYENISTLAHFPKERVLVSPELISEIIKAATKAGATGSVRRVLPVIYNVPEWREYLSPEDISPILEALSQQQSDFYSDNEVQVWELFEDAASPKTEHIRTKSYKYLAYALASLTTAPSWIDGSEAQYLPKAIDHILLTKDWARLKTILHCATRSNNPISEIWRDAIPKKLRDRIELSRFDNSYKAYHLDLLMQRMRDLDSGNDEKYRLREMPNTSEGREWYDRAAQKKRSDRESKRLNTGLVSPNKPTALSL
jgi:hypothetical protein